MKRKLPMWIVDFVACGVGVTSVLHTWYDKKGRGQEVRNGHQRTTPLTYLDSRPA